MSKICSYNGCSRIATTVDSDGDVCCALCEGKENEYVMIANIGEDGADLAAEHVDAVEEGLEALGWDVLIRAPIRGEAVGTYLKGGSALRILGYTVPVPEGLRDAIETTLSRVVVRGGEPE